jgi:hexosaminidase
MQFWADIVLHYPELIGELPKDVIALDWGYDADHPLEKETKALADAQIPFYVCPGTSTWLSISGRTDNAIANLRAAAASGLASGAIGFLNTDWGDYGHLQYLPVSFLPLALGAAYSWCFESNRDIDLLPALDLHVFRDASGTMAKLMHDFGNVYQAVRTPTGMSTRLFWSLMSGNDDRKLWQPITPEEYDEAESRLTDVTSRLNRTQMDRPDAELIKSEVRNSAAMLRFACGIGRWRMDRTTEDALELAGTIRRTVAEHRRLWLARNRPGGLNDSVGRLERCLTELNATPVG